MMGEMYVPETARALAQALETSFGLSSALGTTYFSLDGASANSGGDQMFGETAKMIGETVAQPSVTTDPSDPERAEVSEEMT
jgi:hypothetical protein